MKITQEVRDYADNLGLDDDGAMKKGMEEKALEFRDRGSKLYEDV